MSVQEGYTHPLSSGAFSPSFPSSFCDSLWIAAVCCLPPVLLLCSERKLDMADRTASVWLTTAVFTSIWLFWRLDDENMPFGKLIFSAQLSPQQLWQSVFFSIYRKWCTLDLTRSLYWLPSQSISEMINFFHFWFFPNIIHKLSHIWPEVLKVSCLNLPYVTFCFLHVFPSLPPKNPSHS